MSIIIYNHYNFNKIQFNQYTSFCLALVSKKAACHESANLFPCSAVIIRSTYRSVLFPTKTIGTL
jgi:hypothetical protein